MKLFELSFPDTRFKAHHKLLDAGYQLLGNGSWGMVYKKPNSSYVLKVFSYTDKAYLAYLALIKNNQNIHFPKIFGKLIQVTPTYYAVRLEQLGKILSNDKSNQFISMANVYIRGKNTEAELRKNHYFWNEYINVKNEIEKDKELKEACDLILTLVPPFILDIKKDNVMLRGNTFVFSDPIMGDGGGND